MKTVRRLYFYAIAFISIEVVLWGLINLLRSIVDETVGGQAEALAQALALILVGMPIFLFHWLWAQRTSARDEEEQTASLRAIFFYGILLATLIPLVQNVLALIDTIFLDSFHLDVSRAILGHSQPWPDSLIAIFMNGVAALYFWNVLRSEWGKLPAKNTFSDVRRLYRYVWTLYSLLMTIFGAQQILRFLFYVPSDVLGDIGSETAVNGIALLVVGAPIWYYVWRIIQASLSDAAERESNLRLGILYVLALSGVITVLGTATVLIQTILNQLLGAALSTSDFVQRIGDPISIGLPLGAVWAYFGFWLNRHIESIPDPVRQAGMKRIYFYILSALGLGGAFSGIAILIKFMIDFMTGGLLALDDTLRSNLTGAVALIAAWLPLWLLTWRPMQAEALAADSPNSSLTEEQSWRGEHARRSVIRRAYLYLALFAGVVGGMTAAVALLFELLRAVFTGSTDSTFLATILNDLQVLVLFAILLIYHLSVLRRDGKATADVLMKRQSDFKVLVVDSGEGMASPFKAAIGKLAPNIPVAISAEKPLEQFNALILSGSLAVNAPDWIRAFSGTRVILPNEAEGLVWAGGVSDGAIQQAAQAVRQLAEGQPVGQKSVGTGWRLIIYVAAALFGLQLLLGLTLLVVFAFNR